MIFSPPPPPSGPLAVYLNGLVEAIRRSLIPLINKDEATDRVILLSPNGTSYNVKVNDSGVLEVSVNTGKTPVAGFFSENFDRADQALDATGLWVRDSITGGAGSAMIKSGRLSSIAMGQVTAYFSPNL